MLIKILRKLRYRTVKKYRTDYTDDTFIVLSTTVYRQFSFLRTILNASVDVSTTKFIFTSYFLWSISLENSRNLLIRFRRFIFYSVTISLSYISQPLPSKIGHPPLSSASPVKLRLRVGPRALSGKKKN